MTGKHTPGPWVKDKYGTLRGSNGVQVVVRSTGMSNACTWEDEEVLANSRLIESAEELYRALKYARRFVKESDVDTDYIDGVLSKVEGAP